MLAYLLTMEKHSSHYSNKKIIARHGGRSESTRNHCMMPTQVNMCALTGVNDLALAQPGAGDDVAFAGH